jgi:hypothetical protein
VTLETLIINSCFLSGSIPTEIGLLTALKVLDLSTNAPLVGSIPTELGALTMLETLDLGNNQLTGTIPEQLSDISTLQSVTLVSNNVTGEVPALVCALAADPTYQLDVLIVDCAGDPPKVTCAVPDCCSACSLEP